MRSAGWWSVRAVVAIMIAASLTTGAARAADAEIAALVAKVLAVKPMGAGHKEAAVAIRELTKADGAKLPDLLAGFDGADVLAANWLRGAVEAVAQRTLDKGGKLPIADLETFLAQTTHAPRGRRLAYELIARVDAQAETRLIPGLIDDPSLELRRDAVALALKNAEAKLAAGDKEAAAAGFRRAFRSSRDQDQVKTAAAKLRDLGDKVDLPTHYGFVMNWKLVAPFDNVGGKGFDVAYPPEREVDLKAEYKAEHMGKESKIGWVEHATTDDYGLVDLNKALAKHKGAIAYAYAEFVAPRDMEVDFRLGSDCANKVWLNSELVTSNQVYHANMVLDQYIGKAKLKKGRNQILLKIAQNEQTEAWAQDWKFQFRVCDSIGTAVLSQDRAAGQTAAR